MPITFFTGPLQANASATGSSGAIQAGNVTRTNRFPHPGRSACTVQPIGSDIADPERSKLSLRAARSTRGREPGRGGPGDDGKQLREITRREGFGRVSAQGAVDGMCPASRRAFGGIGDVSNRELTEGEEPGSDRLRFKSPLQAIWASDEPARKSVSGGGSGNLININASSTLHAHVMLCRMSSYLDH